MPQRRSADSCPGAPCRRRAVLGREAPGLDLAECCTCFAGCVLFRNHPEGPPSTPEGWCFRSRVARDDIPVVQGQIYFFKKKLHSEADVGKYLEKKKCTYDPEPVDFTCLLTASGEARSKWLSGLCRSIVRNEWCGWRVGLADRAPGFWGWVPVWGKRGPGGRFLQPPEERGGPLTCLPTLPLPTGRLMTLSSGCLLKFQCPL